MIATTFSGGPGALYPHSLVVQTGKDQLGRIEQLERQVEILKRHTWQEPLDPQVCLELVIRVFTTPS
jgi:hypothetical protein